MKRIVAIVCIVLLPWAALGAAESSKGARFEVVGEGFGAADAVAVFKQHLAAGRMSEAARQFDALMRQRADDLVWEDESGLVSVTTLAEQLIAGKRGAVAAEYRRLVDSEAAKTMDALREDAAVRGEDFYQLARRYSLSSIAGAAYAEAADRAVAEGDFAAGALLYDLAKRHGGMLQARQESIWARCRDLMSQGSGYRGAVAFDATWYGHVGAVGQAKYFPQAADGVLYFAGGGHAFAVKETGALLWRWGAPGAWAGTFAVDRGRERGHGSSYQCSLFAGAAGARIVLVRQPKGVVLDHHLRALRATDGKLLWTTENAGGFERLSLAGNPIIAGRYAYAVAVDFGDDPATLVLVGIDLMRGQVSIKTPLGTLLEMRNQREVMPGWDDFWEQSEPAVSGDAVYVTPNVGVAYCVGRFDGRIRWARIYEEPQTGRVWRDRGRRPARAEQQTAAQAPVNAEQLLRWRGTPQVCGSTVVIAPQDNIQVWGLDAATGKVLWVNAYPGGYCLIGASDTMAVLAGANVTGIEAANGRMVWRYEPPSGLRLSGPAATDGTTAWVPTSDGKLTALDLRTGRPGVSGQKMPSLRASLGNADTRKLLEEARILGSLAGGTP